ncbi:hypothetical protein PR048_015446 [Dryococelus australis]|uniref:Uncharacterized protein n=1 Tax=Dryococelus australis TaxID=614101 RepID=A0ABQ9HGY7_9NEOP|nr:hypothetical protein PR048_015446 [Dryococelus australis]
MTSLTCLLIDWGPGTLRHACQNIPPATIEGNNAAVIDNKGHKRIPPRCLHFKILLQQPFQETAKQNQYMTTGRFERDGVHVPIETRGGDRRSKAFERKSMSVKDFIQTFKAVESHYCRGKSELVYFDSNLNTMKMWRMYNQKVHGDIKVKESYFRHVFSTYFNIIFKAPSTDVCPKCCELTGRILKDTDIKKGVNK